MEVVIGIEDRSTTGKFPMNSEIGEILLFKLRGSIDRAEVQIQCDVRRIPLVKEQLNQLVGTGFPQFYCSAVEIN